MPLEGELEDSVARAVENVGPPASLVGLISLLLLVYAASGMMGATRSAFRAIWGEEPGRTCAASLSTSRSCSLPAC